MCYRSDCKEQCDEFKKMYCIMRITKKQKAFIDEIHSNTRGRCKECGRETIKAKHRKIQIDLCTECGVLNKAI